MTQTLFVHFYDREKYGILLCFFFSSNKKTNESWRMRSTQSNEYKKTNKIFHQQSKEA